MFFGQKAYATESEQNLENDTLILGEENNLTLGENVVSEGNGEGNNELQGSGEGNNNLQNNGVENVLLQNVPEGTDATAQPVSYDVNAALYDQRETAETPDGQDRPGGEYPGVYVTEEITPNAETTVDEKTFEGAPTIGIPSIADQNLADAPTTESPAIIQGAAVGYEEKTGPVNYESYDPTVELPEPYSDFRYQITQQQAADGTMVDKLTGFDQTYVVVRVDVSQFFAEEQNADTSGTEPQEAGGSSDAPAAAAESAVVGQPEGENTTNTSGEEVQNTVQTGTATKYLHVKQEDNRALIPGAGIKTNDFVAAEQTGGNEFKDQLGSMTGAYSLEYLKQKATDVVTGVVKPYVDILLFATSSNVAGADAKKEGTPVGDVKLSMYVDETQDYNTDLKYDPMSTDVNHATQCLAKFFDTAKAAVNSISHYLVKGSDLKLEAAVEKQQDAKAEETTGESSSESTDQTPVNDFFGTGTEYWSLEKSFEQLYYDQEADKSAEDPNCGKTIVLMSEVSIVDGLTLTGTDKQTGLKKRTLDVNSYDVQVASNTASQEQGYSDGFEMTNAWLKIMDGTKTTGSEVAIGNNSRFVINDGGKLIIDETCQLEMEWDGASTTPTEGTTPAPAPETLNNGVLDLNPGGEVVNYGVISIEGYEGKPAQPGTQPVDPTGCGEMTIEEGATFTNYGTFVVNGKLYVLGTLNNYGRYNDTISSVDPDKGRFDYHKGIQLSFKDDVTQTNYKCGEMIIGKDKNGTINTSARVDNYGDIVLIPGNIYNYGVLANKIYLDPVTQTKAHGNIYMAAATEAIIPIEPDPATPTIVTKKISIDPPTPSHIYNDNLVEGKSGIYRAYVKLNDNIGLGKMTVYDVIEASEDGTFTMDSYEGYPIPTDPVPEEPKQYEPAPGSEPEVVIPPAPKMIKISVTETEYNVDGKPLKGKLEITLNQDQSFVIKVPGKTAIKGKFVVIANTIKFVLPDGTMIEPKIDKNGNYVYTVVQSDKSVITFILTPDQLKRMMKTIV